jgi:cytochrome c oxidase subunit 2
MVMAPLNYLVSYGERAASIATLTWGVLLISIAVTVIISALVAAAVWRREPLIASAPGDKLPVSGSGGGMRWLWTGVGISTLVLLFTVGWTLAVLAKISSPASRPPLTIEVIGHQWWWEVRYLSDDPGRLFTTANEIHIPTGTAVRFRLVGADVIHSFWVPALAGKTDMIPGQTNETWLQARTPGVYRGQCSEYCGVQHARMSLLVVAQPAAQFRAWWDHQLESPAAATGPDALGGAADFGVYCGSCHAVRGTDAGGILGPDLSHLMTRGTLAAGTYPNDSAHLASWIIDPQGMKPGNMMQPPRLSATQLAAVRAYLNTLN